MNGVAKFIGGLGALWLIIAVPASYYLINLPIWKGGLYSVEDEAALSNRMDSLGRLLDGLLSLGLLGAALLVLSGILYCLSQTMRLLAGTRPARARTNPPPHGGA